MYLFVEPTTTWISIQVPFICPKQVLVKLLISSKSTYLVNGQL